MAGKIRSRIPGARWAHGLSLRCRLSARPGLGLAANPLRRRGERWQAAATIFAVLIVILAVPVAVLSSIGLWNRNSDLAVAQRASRRSTAVVITTSQHAWGVTNHLVTFRWKDGSGTLREGASVVNGDLGVGETMHVWTDGRGRLTGAPLNTTDVAIDSVGLGLAIQLSALVLGGLVRTLTRRRLATVRSRAWEEEWRRFDQARSQDTKGGSGSGGSSSGSGGSGGPPGSGGSGG
jgi:hypothetical protein